MTTSNNLIYAYSERRKLIIHDGKQYPMLFSTAMINAIIDGNKTQTRRIANKNSNIDIGDIIWCRETWAETCDENGTPIIAYKVGLPRIILGNEKQYELGAENPIDWHIDNYPSCGRWKPSIFMPKFACRLFLYVKDKRMQKLQEISDSDCIAEGISIVDYIDPETKTQPLYNNYQHGVKQDWGFGDLSKTYAFSNPKDSYRTLWQSINGKDSWAENPDVFVYTFKKVDENNLEKRTYI